MFSININNLNNAELKSKCSQGKGPKLQYGKSYVPTARTIWNLWQIVLTRSDTAVYLLWQDPYFNPITLPDANKLYLQGVNFES